MLHLSTKAFEVTASDWSADVRDPRQLGAQRISLFLTTQLKMAIRLDTAINYYNLTNSHWEPLMDPWQFGLKVRFLSSRPDLTANWKG